MNSIRWDWVKQSSQFTVSNIYSDTLIYLLTTTYTILINYIQSTPFDMANPPSSPQFDWKMYRYIPSPAGATIAMTIFLVLTLLHIWKYLTTRSHLLVYVILGALCPSP
jgi:hypothetical protein